MGNADLPHVHSVPPGPARALSFQPVSVCRAAQPESSSARPGASRCAGRWAGRVQWAVSRQGFPGQGWATLASADVGLFLCHEPCPLMSSSVGRDGLCTGCGVLQPQLAVPQGWCCHREPRPLGPAVHSSWTCPPPSRPRWAGLPLPPLRLAAERQPALWAPSMFWATLRKQDVASWPKTCHWSVESPSQR